MKRWRSTLSANVHEYSVVRTPFVTGLSKGALTTPPLGLSDLSWRDARVRGHLLIPLERMIPQRSSTVLSGDGQAPRSINGDFR